MTTLVWILLGVAYSASLFWICFVSPRRFDREQNQKIDEWSAEQDRLQEERWAARDKATAEHRARMMGA